jgi:uncharacterized protein YegP (UPF0339 family)
LFPFKIHRTLIHQLNEKGIMKNLNGYSVEQIGSSFAVVFLFQNGEKMMMSKLYSRLSSANKAFDKVVYQAGIL